MFHSFIILISLMTFVARADFDWQGHRGARGLYPENTINGMKEAVKFPITTLELDVVISKDNEVVVSHEPWMSEEICLDSKGKPVKDREVNLYTLNYDVIKTYDCGTKPHPRFLQQKKIREFKPLLSDLISAIEPSKYKYNIEIKSTPEDEKSGFQPEYKQFTNLAIVQIMKFLPVDRFTIQSFDWRVLKHVHKMYPQISTGALRETKYKAKDVLKELGFAPTVFSPDWEMLTAKDVKFFHRKKILVVPWTVNSIKDMEKLIFMRVDGIITDYPNLIMEIPQKIYLLEPECLANFNRFEGRCVKIPKHAVASIKNPGWVCNVGYMQKRNTCVKIKIPKNARLSEDGKTWICEEGFKRYRYTCKQ